MINKKEKRHRKDKRGPKERKDKEKRPKKEQRGPNRKNKGKKREMDHDNKVP